MPAIAIIIVIGAGFLVGLAIGRWWALLAALGVGVFVAAQADVEVSSEFLGAAIGSMFGAGTAVGVLLRKRSARAASRERPGGRS